MNTASRHLKRYPSARPSTIALLQKRDEKTAELRREIKAGKAKRSFLGRMLSFVRGE
jgi:hypothetical protein